MKGKFVNWKKGVSLLLAAALTFSDTAGFKALAAAPEAVKMETAESAEAEESAAAENTAEAAADAAAKSGEETAISPVLGKAERKDKIEKSGDGWLKRSRPEIKWEPDKDTAAVTAGAFSDTASAVSGSGMKGYIDSGVRVRSLQDQPEYSAKSSLPAKYDAREKSTVTPVKNQELFGLCWAFATLSASEANALLDGLGSRDFSELALGYYTYNRVGRSDYGNTIGDEVILPASEPWPDAGGNELISMWALANWMMPLEESLAPYIDTYKYIDTSVSMEEMLKPAYEEAEAVVTKDEVKAKLYQSAVHLQNAYMVSQKDRDEIKKLIMEYGAVGSAYYDITENHNTEKNAYYQNRYESSNHEITIAGWDDTYDKSNFNANCQPSGNGAWLIKNSWGTNWGDSGYFWISYEDPSLSDVFAYDVEPANNYGNIYQYDGGSSYNAIGYSKDKIMGANVFTAVGDENLSAVAFATMDPNIDYSIQIYKNPNPGAPESGTKMLKSEKTGTVLYAGYHTVPVDTVQLSKGDTFSVVVTLSTKDGSKAWIWTDEQDSWQWVSFEGAAAPGQSYIKYQGGNWTDFSAGVNSGTRKGNLRIKAFTSNQMSLTGQPSEYLWKGDTVQLSVKNLPEGETAEWSSSDPGIATVSSNGLVTAVGYGTAVIQAKVGASKAEAEISVKSIEIVGEDTLYVGQPETAYAVKLMPDETAYEIEEWTSSDSSIAVIDSKNGAARAVKAGTVTFTAKTKDGKAIQKEVRCYLAAEEIVLTPEKVLFENENEAPVTITAAVMPEGANQKVVWTSKNQTVAEVSESGVITPKKVGETIITAVSESDSEVKEEAEVIVKGILLNTNEIDLVEQDSFKLKAALYGLEEDSVSWKIKEGEDAITLTETDSKEEILVEAKAGCAGKTAVITVNSGSYSVDCRINVKQLDAEVKALTLNLKKADLIAGKMEESRQSLQLRAVITPEEIPASFVKWSSSNEKIAKVSEKGEVTGTGEEFGTVTITAAVSLNGSSKSADCVVTVYPLSPSEKLSAKKTAYLLEKSAKFTSEETVVIVNQDNERIENTLFEWSSSNSSVCTVDPEGRLLPSGKGNAVITALLKGDPSKRKLTVKAEVVEETQIAEITVTNTENSAAVDSCADAFNKTQPLTYQFTAAAKMTDGTVYDGEFTWKVSDSSAAAVKYNKATKTAAVTVKKPAFFSVICEAKDKAKTSRKIEIYAYQFNPLVDFKNLTVNTNFEVQKNDITSQTETVAADFVMRTITGTAINASELSVQIMKKGAASGVNGYISKKWEDNYTLYVPKTVEKGKYTVQITGKALIENTALKQKIGETADILVEFPLTVDSNLPKVTLNASFNTYYKNESSYISTNLYSWELEEIKKGSDTQFNSKFEIEGDDGYYFLKAVNGYDTKLKSGKVVVKLDGYEPFEATIKIKYNSTRPVLKVTDKPLINVSGANRITVDILEKYGKQFMPCESLSKEDIDLSKAGGSSDNDSFEIIDVDDGRVYLKFKGNQAVPNKAYKLILPVQKSDWSEPVELKVTVKTTNADVKTKLGTSTLIINQAPGIRAEAVKTSVLYDQTNVVPDLISIVGLPKGLEVSFRGDEIRFQAVSEIENKTYTLELTPKKYDEAYKFKPVKLKLKAGEFAPQVNIKGKGTLDLVNRDTTSMALSFSVKNIGSAISEIELDSASEENFSFEDGILKLKSSGQLFKGKQNVCFVITLESGQKLYKNFSVNLKQTLPKLYKINAPVLHKTVFSKAVRVYGYVSQKETDSAKISSVEIVAPEGIQVVLSSNTIYKTSFSFSLDASDSTLKPGKYKVKARVFFKGSEKTAKFPKGQPVEQTITVTVAE